MPVFHIPKTIKEEKLYQSDMRDNVEIQTGKAPFLKRVWDLYYDGFRSMTVGKSLWVLIIVKLFVMFVIMKWLFFPNILKENYDNDEERAEAVRTELTNR